MSAEWDRPARSGQGFAVVDGDYTIGFVSQNPDGTRRATCWRNVLGDFARPAEADRAVRQQAPRRRTA